MPKNKKIQIKVTGNLIKTQAKIIADTLDIEAEYLFNQAELEIKQNVRHGESKKAAIKIVENAILKGDGFAKPWFTRINRIESKLINNMVARPVENYAEQNKKLKFLWVLSSVKVNHCPDCISLSAMEARTIVDWRALGFGLPREGQTQCNVGCGCMLEPV